MSSLINQNQHGRIALSAEVVRMAQIRANRQGVQFRQELARLVAEEAIMALDYDLGLLIESNALSQSDAMAAALGVNDLVVNGQRMDIRALDEDGEVSVARALVGSQYLSLGSLIVELDGVSGGSIVGHVSSGAWLKAEDGLRDAETIRMPVEIKADFDLSQTIVALAQKAPFKLPAVAKLANFENDVNDLFNNKGRLIASRQKQIFSYLCAHWSDEMLAQVEAIGCKLPAAKVTRVLFAAGRWHATSERLADKLALRFKKLSRDQILAQILTVGEKLGGEIKAPAFRHELLTGLAASELAMNDGIQAKAAQAVMAKVMSGASAVEVVKSLVKNAVAVDLALAIKSKRQAAAGFMAATAEEIGMAFQQLALQPAYATHSSGDSGVDSINEALALLQATDMADIIAACDQEMAQF